MPLTEDEMIEIMLEETLGKEPTIKGPEADRFREAIRREVKEAKEKGWMIEIPATWPTLD